MKKTGLILVWLAASFCLKAQDIRKVSITELKTIIAQSKTPLVVNFWATFCVPCVEEIPYFQRMTEAFKEKKVSLLLVSMDMPEDYPGNIRAFAKAHGFTAPIVWLNESDADYYCPRIDSSWSGVIPATLFINMKTGYRKFAEEKIKAAGFKSELEKLVAE